MQKTYTVRQWRQIHNTHHSRFLQSSWLPPPKTLRFYLMVDWLVFSRIMQNILDWFQWLREHRKWAKEEPNAFWSRSIQQVRSRTFKSQVWPWWRLFWTFYCIYIPPYQFVLFIMQCPCMSALIGFFRKQTYRNSYKCNPSEIHVPQVYVHHSEWFMNTITQLLSSLSLLWCV